MKGIAPALVALARSRGRTWSWNGLLIAAGVVLCAGLSLLPASAFLVQAYTPSMTRGRKRELVAELLPTAIPILCAAAALAVALAARRCGSARRAALGTRSGALGRRALELFVIALTLALSTPLLQALFGGSAEIAWTTLFDSPERTGVTLAGVSAIVLIEDILVRWLPIEVFLTACRHLRIGGVGARVAMAVALSTVLASLAHATPAVALPSLEAWLQYGAPKAPAALLFAVLYARRGIVDAWLVHVFTNLGILALVPFLAEA